MRLPVTGVLIVTLVLAGCGRARESRLNPFNWFGRSEETTQTVTEGAVPGRPDDGRILIAQVTDLEVARQPGGAIVRASGVPPTQGWWNTDLVAENGGVPVDGVLTYRFVIAEPLTPNRASTPQSRELTAATYVSDIKLEGVSQIVVLGAENSRSSRR